MPLIRVTPELFPGTSQPALLASGYHAFTWDEIIWAAVTVGRAELMHVLRHGIYSRFEISYRSSIVYANLREQLNSRLCRSSAYDGLDPSEKSAISYFLGLAVTKAVVHRIFDVPWLMHLDVYRAVLQPVLPPGQSRPDLAGQDTAGNWIIVESKGRTNGFDETAMQKAKDQAALVTQVGGVPPSWNIGALLHFGGGDMELRIRDPKPDRESDLRLPISSELLLDGYYRPFREWLRRSPSARAETVDGDAFLVADLPDLDLTVGVDAVMLNESEAPSPEQFRARSRDRAPRELPRDQGFLGRDGVLIRTGPAWNNENMRLEPQQRTALG